MAGNIATLIRRLIELIPDSTEAEAEEIKIRSKLLEALDIGGRQGAEALINTLSEDGFELVHVKRGFWRVELPPPRVLEFWFNPPDDPIIATASYRSGKPWGTPSQKRAAARQEAFYARYEKLIPIDDSAAAELSPEDRLIFVIGEFEADVNNGGFGQYLDNKGLRRAQEALRYLEQIGAGRTARWLSSAPEAAADPAALDRLDNQFFNKPQDLPSLVMRYLAKGKTR